MNLKEFSKEEKEGLLELLLAGMYSDAHVALEEDARIKRLLSEFEWGGEYRQEQVLNAALTRVREKAASREGIRGHAESLAQVFATTGHREQACRALEELLTSDEQLTQSEQNFLNTVRSIFAA